MDLYNIIEKISGHVPDANTGRGDHDLNPDMGVATKLTPAAVLVPLVLRDDGITVLFTQRTAHLEHHPGQLSFPGGHVDPGDRTPDETALRETEEEVGLDRRHIEIIGHLDVYRTRTGFSVTPVVGLVTPPFKIDPDTHEVEEVFEVPLPFLLNASNHERHTREIRGVEREFYAMPYNGHYIWGATAGILINLYDILTGN